MAKKTARPIRPRPATPLITPPAIGPALDFLDSEPEPELGLPPVAAGDRVIPSAVVAGEMPVSVLNWKVMLGAGDALDSGRSSDVNDQHMMYPNKICRTAYSGQPQLAPPRDQRCC